jgi:hypothetical protein
MKQLCFHWAHFFFCGLYWGGQQKSVDSLQFFLKFVKNKEYFTGRTNVFFMSRPASYSIDESTLTWSRPSHSSVSQQLAIATKDDEENKLGQWKLSSQNVKLKYLYAPQMLRYTSVSCLVSQVALLL